MENIPTITITPEHSTVLNNLIKAVHHYYPIGFTLRNDQYDGFLELKELAKNKVLQTINETIPKDRLKFLDQLKAFFKDCRVTNDFHIEYPSLSYSIVIAQHDSLLYKKELLLTIKISLLTSYYTFFYEEYVTHKEVISATGYPYHTTIMSLEAQIDKNKTENIYQLNQMMSHFYPDYAYVNHRLLFTMKVNYGVPLGEDDPYAKKEYPLYTFLFDNQYYINLFVVA